jgi:hypothetical protein
MVEIRRPATERRALGLVAAVTAVVYGPLLRAPYLIWDDDLNIFENPFYQTGHWSKLWAAPYFGMYIPITSMIWAVLFYLGHGAPWPFRVLNTVLHLANLALVVGLISAMLRRWKLPSTVALSIAAVIFALHPQQTAVVAWISGGRDLAATTFALSAVAMQMSARRTRLAWSTLLFALALLCKPSVVSVPVALLLYGWWFGRERFRATLLAGFIWTGLGLISVLITRHAQASMFSVAVPLSHRPVLALDAIGFYLMKLAWPYPLAADYGRRPDVLWATPSTMIATLVVAAALTVAGVIASKRDPRYRLAALWPVLLIPVLGIIPFAYQRISTVADHYDYLPLAVIAAVVALSVAKSPRLNGRAGWGVFSMLLVIYGTASFIRIFDWKGNEPFFDDMMRKNPKSWSAVINIASVQCEKGNWQLGLATIQRTPLLARTDAAFLANETFCLFKGGRYDEVFARQQRLQEPPVVASLDSNPEASAVLANSFAGAFIATDKPLRAFAYLCQAAAVSPQDLAIAQNVARAKEDLRRRGREVTCRGKVPWNVLEQIVQVLP